MESIAKPLPHNSDAEKLLLGALLIGANECESAFDMVRPEDFFLPQNRTIARTLRNLRDASAPVDLLSLHDALNGSGQTEAAGGIGYVAQLSDGLQKVCNPRNFARIVKEKSRLRAIIYDSQKVQEAAFEESERSAKICDTWIEKLSESARDAEAESDQGITHFEAAGKALLRVGENPGPRIYTDVNELDKIIGGFRPGELVVITAETGSGKTLLSQQIRSRACRDGFHSLFCTGEMTAEHLKSRDLAAEAGVSPLKMRRDDLLNKEEIRALAETAGKQCKVCRILDGELELSRIRRVARGMKSRSALDLIVFDYDELIEAPGKDEWEQQKNLTRAAKSLGIELGCCAILISQLRKPLSNEDIAHPTLQRLYGSGAKTKHASIVILADRQYVRELSGDEKEAQIFVLKNRDGRVGRVKASFNVHTLRFESAPPEVAYQDAPHWTEREAEA